MSTTVKGVTVPTSGDAPNVPADLLTLIGSLIGGPVTSGVATAGTDWTANEQFAQRLGMWALIMVAVTYTGSTPIAPNSNGNINPDVPAATLASAWTPKSLGRFPPIPCQSAYNASYAQASWGAVIESSGVLRVTSGPVGFSIASGDTLVFSGTYPLAS